MEETYSDDQENGSGFTTRAGAKARELSEAARGQASEQVRKARARAQVQVEDQRERIASRMDETASSLMHHAEEGDNLRYLAERRVAHGLENAADYLHSHQTNEVAGDVVAYVRQHPVRSLIIAVIFGYLLGKTFG